MDEPERALVSRFWMEVGTAVATATGGAITAYGALEFGIGWDDAGPQPGFFPLYVGLLIVAGSAWVLIQALLQQRRSQAVFVTTAQAKRALAFFVPIVLFVAVSVMLGLYAGMFLYIMGVMLVQGRYRIWTALAVALAITVVSYLVFEVWFQVPLLKGPLEARFGL